MAAQPGHERRRFQRFRFSSVITVQRGDVTQECEMLDMSLRGFLARCPDSWQPAEGDKFKVEWRLADLIKLELDAVVMHVHDGRIGCTWEARDAESFAHLRRLVEVNLLDPKLVERELEALKAETRGQRRGAAH
ncbi:MAG: PilZ domain-containing protein [Gammaproteobacteria bacterium]